MARHWRACALRDRATIRRLRKAMREAAALMAQSRHSLAYCTLDDALKSKGKGGKR